MIVTDQDVACAFERLAVAKAKLAALEQRLAAKIARLRAKADQAAAAHRDAIAVEEAAIVDYATANRDRLTAGTKTARFAGGKVAWRTATRVELLADEKEIIAELRRRRLGRYVRTEEHVDRRVVASDPIAAQRLGHLLTIQTEERPTVTVD